MIEIDKYFSFSEQGKRTKQDDFIWPQPDMMITGNRLFMVCDGVGGLENGGIASRLVCEKIAEYEVQLPYAQFDRHKLLEAVAFAQYQLVTYAELFEINTPMATTLTLIHIGDNKVLSAHIGDSRIYHLRNGRIIYRTEDHSLINEYLRNGQITEVEALNHPQRNVITRSIHNSNEKLTADVYEINDVISKDIFLLCTDGVLEGIDDALLEFMLADAAGLQEVTAAIRKRGLQHANDNFSAILIQIK